MNLHVMYIEYLTCKRNVVLFSCQNEKDTDKCGGKKTFVGKNRFSIYPVWAECWEQLCVNYNRCVSAFFAVVSWNSQAVFSWW